MPIIEECLECQRRVRLSLKTSMMLEAAKRDRYFFTETCIKCGMSTLHVRYFLGLVPEDLADSPEL